MTRSQWCAHAAGRPKKSLGQHFLMDRGICKRIVDLLEANSESKILEIGPGAGALTKQLIELHPAQLLLLEKDSYWANHWQTQGTTSVLGDAMCFNWAALTDQWRLIGNLPYNVASPLIWDIVSQCRCWLRAVFMLQKEVAQRICAVPDNGHYGSLSIWVQSYARVSLAFTIGPGAFRPRPKVDSAVVCFDPLNQQPAHPKELKAILKLCFQQRRKQLGSILRPFPVLQQALTALKIDAKLRPENLPPATFAAMAKHMAADANRLEQIDQ